MVSYNPANHKATVDRITLSIVIAVYYSRSLYMIFLIFLSICGFSFNSQGNIFMKYEDVKLVYPVIFHFLS